MRPELHFVDWGIIIAYGVFAVAIGQGNRLDPG